MRAARRLPDVVVFTALAVACTCLSFGALSLGRGLVVSHATAALRSALVRESDLLAEGPVSQVLHSTGCHESEPGATAHRSCVFLSAVDRDSIRVALRLEPRSRLLLPDSAVFMLPSPSPSN